MTQHCPTCGHVLASDPVEAQIESIRQRCEEIRVPIVAGNLLQLEGAAMVMKRSVPTINRWLAAGALEAKLIRGRRHIPIVELARLICGE